MDEYDRSLRRADIMEIMHFTGREATKFMQAFGHRTDSRHYRTIGQRELTFLQLDGRLAEWVKNNLPEDRRTVAKRRGQHDAGDESMSHGGAGTDVAVPVG